MSSEAGEKDEVLSPCLSLVLRFVDRRQLGLLGCAPCSPSGGPFWPLSSPNPPKRTSPARSAWLAPSGGPFRPLSSPSPPKRTSPCWSAWLSSLLSLWWSVLAAQQPKSSKTGLASLVCWAVLLALRLVVRFGRSAAQIRQHGPPLLFQPHRSLSLSLPGVPFCPLSGPNPPKRTSSARSAWLCSLLSLWWSVLAAQQPKSSKTDLASLVCWAVLLALPLVVRFGRSAAQILQNEPRQQGLMAGSLWWSVSAAQQPKSPKTDLAMLVCLAELLALPLVVRFGRSAAQILQNGPRQLGLLGCAPCSLSLVVRFGRSAAQILQNGPLASLAYRK